MKQPPKPIQTPLGPLHQKPAPAPKSKPAKSVGSKEAEAREARENSFDNGRK